MTTPYDVEQVETDTGPRWRLRGPGIGPSKTYPWREFRDKLEELAAVMNFAWHQSRAGSNPGHDPEPAAAPNGRSEQASSPR